MAPTYDLQGQLVSSGQRSRAWSGFGRSSFFRWLNFCFVFRHALPLTSPYPVDPPITMGSLLHQYTHPHSTLDFFLGFYFTLNQYRGWIRPLQYRLHYSTVQCIVKLHHAFQNWIPRPNTMGESIFVFFSVHLPIKPTWMDHPLTTQTPYS